MLRGTHYSTDIRNFRTELENFGHTVVNISNIKQNRTNIPLSLFFVDLKPSSNNKHISQTKTLNYTKVKFDLPRPKETYHNIVNVRDMDIPRPTAIAAPTVSNAPAVISPSNVQEKKNLKMSNVSSVMVTTQPTINDALSTKTCRKEPSHLYEANR